jgi:hypothetical protein
MSFPITQSRNFQVSQTVTGQDLGDVLEWLNDRAWPLGGAVLATAMIYERNYFQEEGIPLSVVSSAAVTALPAVFIMLLFVITVLASLIMTPAILLFTPMTAAKDEWLIPDGKTEPRNMVRFGLRWLSSLIPLGLVLFFIGIKPPAWAASHPGLWSFLSLSALLVAGILLLCQLLRHHPNVKLKHISFDFWFAAVFAACLQVLVLTIVALLAARAASLYVEDIGVFLFFLALGIIGLALSQIIGVAAVRGVIGGGNQWKVAGLAVALLVGGGGALPSFSAALAGYSIQVAGPDGKPCAVFVWASGVMPIEAIQNVGNKQRTVNVRILAEADQVYYVRPKNTHSKAISLVPRSSVKTIDVCK